MRDMTLNLIQTDLEKYFVQSLEQDVDIRKIRTDSIDKERNTYVNVNVGQKDEPGSPTLQQNVIKVMIYLKDEGTGSFYNQIVSPILREIIQHRFKWQIYELKYPTEKSQNGSFNSLNGTPRSKGGVLDTPKSSVFIFGGANNSNLQDCPYYIVTNYEKNDEEYKNLKSKYPSAQFKSINYVLNRFFRFKVESQKKMEQKDKLNKKPNKNLKKINSVAQEYLNVFN